MARPITPQIAPPQPARAPEIIPAFVAAPARPRKVPAPRHTESANPHLLPLIAAAVGLVGLAGLAIGGWWLFNQPGRPVGPEPPIVQHDSGTSENAAGGTDTVDPAHGREGETPVAAISAADKQIWLADAPLQRVFRRVGSRWIDYRERSEDWYEPGPAGAGSVRLSDAIRRISIELFDDRAEVSHVNSAPAVVATGRWISAADLPPFAKRPPATNAPDPLRFRSSSWHALVLDGNSSISLPVPAEIARPAPTSRSRCGPGSMPDIPTRV